MKIENTKTEKNREITLVTYNKKQFLRVNHVDKKILEWKNFKTNHFVNAKKFTVLESAFKGKPAVIPAHRHVPEASGKSIPAYSLTPPISYDFSSPIRKSSIDKEIIRLCLEGTKLAAVKYFKDETGLGLKESKDYVDMLHADFLANKKWEKALEPTNAEKKLADEINKRFHTENARKMFINRVRANTNGPLAAIKFIKDETGWQLSDSKIFYEYNVKV